MSWLSQAIHEVSWSSAASIVFGATISAAVSYALQRNSFAEARRQREADKRDNRRALGLNVLTKMMRIASTIELLKQTLDGAFARAQAQGVQAASWAIVVPIANLPGKVHFEPSELTEIMRLDYALFNDIGPFDDVHNSLIELFETYRAERNALTATMKADMNGQLGSTIFTVEEMKFVGPKMVNLDTLVAGMVERASADSQEAWEILRRLQFALNREFGLKLSLERKPFTHQPRGTL